MIERHSPAPPTWEHMPLGEHIHTLVGMQVMERLLPEQESGIRFHMRSEVIDCMDSLFDKMTAQMVRVVSTSGYTATLMADRTVRVERRIDDVTEANS